MLGLDPGRDGRALKPRIGLMLQQGGLFPQITPREALRLFAASIRAPRTRGLLEQLSSATWPSTRFRQLSGGQKQRLSLGLALIGRRAWCSSTSRPRPWIPRRAARPGRSSVRCRQRGTTVLLTTHFMDEAEQLADRVAIVDRGRLVALDTPAGLRRAVAHEIRFATVAEVSAAEVCGRAGPARRQPSSANMTARWCFGANQLPAQVAELTAWLASRNVLLTELRAGSRTLEQAFLTLTSTDPAPHPPPA